MDFAARYRSRMGDAVTTGASVAAAGACAAEVGPEAAPFCASLGGAFAGWAEGALSDLGSYVGGGGCHGFICDQAPPEFWKNKVPAKLWPGVEAVWYSSDLGKAIEAMPFGDIQLDGVPAGTMRRAYESRYWQSAAEAYQASKHGPPPPPPPAAPHIHIGGGTTAKPPMATGAKVAIGVGAATLVGAGGFAIWHFFLR